MTRKRTLFTVIGVAAVTGLLYLSSLPNYLLFHSMAELFSIVIAGSVFIIAWNSRRYQQNKYLTYLGIAYLFIALLDLLHTLSYKGMAVFTDYSYYANQVWIATRYIESATLFAIFMLTSRRETPERYGLVFIVYSVITTAAILSIFVYKVFPVCFIEEEGQTLFKQVSEFVIIGILAAATVTLCKRKHQFELKVFRWLIWSIVLTIASELFFTFYISNYGISNFFGHIFKIGSFYLVYKAIIETGIERPMDLIFNRLKTANREKDRFFSIIGHDLKNPFGGIKSMSELLLAEWNELEDDEKLDYVEEIRKSSTLSLNLLNNLLQWARIQTRGLKPDPTTFQLAQAVDENIELFKPTAKNKQIEVTSEIPEELTVTADKNMVDLLLRNLLSNGIKFTQPHGSITISAEERNDTVQIAVADTGAGMTDEEIEAAFSIGAVKTKKGTANEEGSGLGLILCKEFVESNGGEIWIESSPSKGSTFFFTLPGNEK